MADLINQARALSAIGGPLGSTDPTLTAAELATIDLLITACSAAAVKWCHRDWTSIAYDEVYSIDEQRFGLVLRHYPIISIASIRDTPTPVLQISNTDSVTNQYAVAQPLSTGLSLVRTASGVTTTVTTGLTYAANLTITALAAAVTAIGANWSARAVSPYDLFPSTDLFYTDLLLPPTNVRGNYTHFYAHTNDLTNYACDAPTGRLLIDRHNIGWPLVRFTGPNLTNSTLRVKYTAGFSTIPADIQDAIAEWVAAIFYHTKRDPTAVNVFAAGVTSSGASYTALRANMPPMTEAILNLYRERTITAPGMR